MAEIQVGTLAQAFTGRACGACVAPGLDPDIKEMMLDFELYGHLGTKWMAPRHNLLVNDVTMDEQACKGCLLGRNWFLKVPVSPCMKTDVSRDFQTHLRGVL